MVKLVLSPEGVRKYDLLDSTFDDDHEGATDAALADYASHYFEYDGSGRIILATFGGNCGCAGGTIGTYEFDYETNPSYSDGTGYDATWATRTIVERPDASYLTQYFDEIGQPIHQVITDGDPATGSPDSWATKVVRNSGGIVETIHSPANVTAYTHTLASAALTTSTSAGLVNNFVLDSSGGLRGFLLHKKYQEGTSGSKYLLESYTYTSQSLSGTDGEAVRPMVATIRKYPTAITTGTTDSTLTSYAYTWYSSTLVPETTTVTNPAVSTSKNGSTSSTTSSRHYDLLGRVDFAKDEGGGITYTEYTDGRVTKVIRDADTTKSGSGEDFEGITIPTGFSSSGSPIHEVTTHTYDAQGRRDSSTLPSGRVTGAYVSQTEDRALVSLSYPKNARISPSRAGLGVPPPQPAREYTARTMRRRKCSMSRASVRSSLSLAPNPGAETLPRPSQPSSTPISSRTGAQSPSRARSLSTSWPSSQWIASTRSWPSASLTQYLTPPSTGWSTDRQPATVTRAFSPTSIPQGPRFKSRKRLRSPRACSAVMFPLGRITAGYSTLGTVLLENDLWGTPGSEPSRDVAIDLAER